MSEPPLGSMAAWLRGFYVKSAFLWCWRSILPDLVDSTDLDWVLESLTHFAEKFAVSCGSEQQALVKTRKALLADFKYHIKTRGDDGLLIRLRDETLACVPSSPLQELFDSLSEMVREANRNHACREVALIPSYLVGHPLARGQIKPPDDYFIDAGTSMSSRGADINLKVCLHLYDPRSFLAVPALLTHELVCHAHAHDDSVDNKSLWAEGFMDWVAKYFFQAWLIHIDLPQGDAYYHGESLRQQRFKKWHLTGLRAAMDLIKFLAKKDPDIKGLPAAAATVSVAAAETVAVKLALEVNAEDRPLADKNHLVSRLCRLENETNLQMKIREWRKGSRPAADLLT